jgi:hypothetical protein
MVPPPLLVAGNRMVKPKTRGGDNRGPFGGEDAVICLLLCRREKYLPQRGHGLPRPSRRRLARGALGCLSEGVRERASWPLVHPKEATSLQEKRGGIRDPRPLRAAIASSACKGECKRWALRRAANRCRNRRLGMPTSPQPFLRPSQQPQLGRRRPLPRAAGAAARESPPRPQSQARMNGAWLRRERIPNAPIRCRRDQARELRRRRHGGGGAPPFLRRR